MTATEIPVFRPGSKLVRGKFEVFLDPDGGYRFRYLPAGEWVVAVSAEAFATKEAAMRAVDAMRATANNATIVDLTEAN